MHALAHTHTEQLHGAGFVSGLGGFLKDTAAAEDDHAPRATTSFIQKDA